MVGEAGPGMLDKLAAELIYSIYNFLEPSSHLAFAKTCRIIYIQSRSILEIHRKSHRDSRVFSDRSPKDLVRLYRSAEARVGPQAIEAWHVRKFEIWRERASWEEWKTWEISPDGHVSLAANEEPLPSPFTPLEVQEHIQYMASVFRPTHDHEIIANAFEQGEDDYFKAMIISMLPRLNSLAFVECKMQNQLSTLGWLEQMIQWSLHHLLPWPPGFLSLRKVAVGVPVLDQSEDDSMSSAMSLASLLCLPGIDEIYYRNLVLDDEFEFPRGCLPAPQSSCVKTLILDKIQHDSPRLRKALAEAPTGLETLVIHGNPAEPLSYVDFFPRKLSASASQLSLRKFLYYEPDCMIGYRCTSFEPSEMLEIENLRMMTLCVDDVLMECYCFNRGMDFYNTRGSDEEEDVSADEISGSGEGGSLGDIDMESTAVDGSNGISDSNSDYIHESWLNGYMPTDDIFSLSDHSDHFGYDGSLAEMGDGPDVLMANNEDHRPISHDDVVNHFLTCLPRTLEVLILWGDEDEVWYERGAYEQNEAVDDAIVAVINSKSCPNLKAIYLDDIEKSTPVPRTKVCFQKAMAAGKAHGIYINTLSNQHEPIPQLDFPIIPDKHDIKTGPFPARDPTWIFDPFAGAWTTPGCASCGSCEACLRYYTSDAWEAFKEQKL